MRIILRDKLKAVSNNYIIFINDYQSSNKEGSYTQNMNPQQNNSEYSLFFIFFF